MSVPRSSFISGFKAVLPIQVGVIPFGMIYGVLALDAGLTAAQAQAMSFIVFAGSAQFIMAQLFDAQTSTLVIILTAAMVNLRHMLYSASISSAFSRLSLRWRLFLAYFLTDEAYAVSITRFHEGIGAHSKRYYYLGAGIGLWGIWQASTAAGILIGARIPAEWSLDFFVALTFIALVVPSVKDWAGLIAALTAGVASIFAFDLPYGLGLIVAALIGITAGLVAERVIPVSPSQQSEEESIKK
ncbi:MAG: AzlC family ABC transporter permease [Anaerolineae bacterium]|nr:MAG: AzlC family ABC transporter permease [Anaerolineae bacterium]